MYKRKGIYKKKQSRSNPYFRDTQSKWKIRRILRIIFSVGIFIALLVLFTYGTWFRLNYVNVIGGSEQMNSKVSKLSDDFLQKKVLLILPRNHKVLFSEKKLSKILTDKFPLNYANIEVNGSGIQVEVKEKISTFYLIKDDVMFAVDREGAVLGVITDLDRMTVESKAKSDATMPIIRDSRSGKIGEGSVALSAEWLEAIVKLFDQVKARTMLTPQTADLSDDEGRVDITTDAGVTLYFTLNRPVDLQISKLESLIDRKLVEITNLSYIDLRFTNRLFYH